MSREKLRCAWVNPENALYVAYHDEEWGVPVHDDRTLFEMICLEGAQAGLSWETVLKKRDGYRKAFHDFDIARVARMRDSELEKRLLDPGIIRHRGKIWSVRENARATLQVQREHGSLDRFLWTLAGGATERRRWKKPGEVRAKTEVSDRMSKELKRRGFKFVGSTICYAFMQAVGMVDEHMEGCFRALTPRERAGGGSSSGTGPGRRAAKASSRRPF